MSIKWAVLFVCAFGMAKAQSGYSRDNPSNQLSYNSLNQRGQGGYSDESDELNGDEIPGEAGRDYPVYAEVPETSFSCANQQFPGYYADPEAQCQAFYICQKGGKSDSFLCPNGTVFNQEYLVCDWWYNFECSRAEGLYGINEQIVRAMEEADAKLGQQRGGYNYNAPGDAQNGRNGGASASSPSAMYGAPSKNGFNGNGNKQSNGFNSKNAPSQSYGAPAQFDASSLSGSRMSPNNAFSSLPRGYDSTSQNGPSKSYGTPSNNGNGRKNGGSNGNSNNKRPSSNGNGFNRNGASNGFTAPKPMYGAPSASSNGLAPQFNSNGPNAQGSNLSAYKNGLGNGPSDPSNSYLPPREGSSSNRNSLSSEYGTPAQDSNQYNFNEPNAYNGAASMDQYDAPARSYLPSSQ